jgi:hypothetical protein
MPDFELLQERTLLANLAYRGEHAWVTSHNGPCVNLPGNVRGGFLQRPHFWSSSTRNWERKIRWDPEGVLPACLMGHPPDLRTSYGAPTQAQSAWDTHLALVDFYDRLNNGEKTAKLWQKLRALCFDDLEYQFRASSLVRVAIMAVAGEAEQWNGPQARKTFNRVKKASIALRRAFEAAGREFLTPPVQDGIDPDIVRGPMPPTTTEELEASVRARELEASVKARETPEARETRLAREQYLDNAACLASLDDHSAENAYDDLLDKDGVRMRDAWSRFWNNDTSLLLSCDGLEKMAADVEAAWKAAPKYNVFKDPGKRKVGYLMSKVGLHLNDRFPTQDVGALANVCDELVELAYPGVDRLNASLKSITRERAKGQNAKK